MIKKLATLVCAAAFGLALYSPTASACPGHEDKPSVAKKDKADKDKKVADKKKAKKDKTKSTKKKVDKKKDGKKVSRK